jgi:hypothetical protein
MYLKNTLNPYSYIYNYLIYIINRLKVVNHFYLLLKSSIVTGLGGYAIAIISSYMVSSYVISNY